MKSLLILPVLLVATLACNAPSREGTAPVATVTIDTGAPAVPYNRMIFGGFLEHFDGQIYGGIFDPGSPLADENGFRTDVIAAMKELKLSVVRWPGGCFASGYHWKDGVGKKRMPVEDPVWGVTDPNTFGTDEFVSWCRLVGCEPYICTNAGNGTAQEMKEWVEYCNGTEGTFASLRRENGHDSPFGVRFWSVGNENWGQHEIGPQTPETWGPFVDQAAGQMLDADSSLILAAAATTDRNWTLPLLRHAGHRLGLVAIHNYWLGLWQQNDMPDYLTCIMTSRQPKQNITGAIAILEEAGYRGKIRIAFDEWNLRGWHHPGFPRKETVKPGDTAALALIARRDQNAVARQYTLADALFSASFLNACLRHSGDVAMANIAPIINTRGPLYVHPKGIVKRTTFHTLAMYANELEACAASVKVASPQLTHRQDSLDVVDALATVSQEGDTWALSLVNRHPAEAIPCSVILGDKPLRGTFPALILSGDSPDSFNDIDNPDRVVPVETELTFRKGIAELPPHSLVIIKIKL